MIKCSLINIYLIMFGRWDVKMINELPDYMKMPFLVLHNTINEMVFEVLRDQDIVINIDYLKKTVSYLFSY